MALNRALVLAAALAFLSCSSLLCQEDSANPSRCEAPAYFGVCDPYVPGVIVTTGAEGRVLVSSTWPSGPADQAGLCPGDEVVSINGTLSSGREFPDVIRALVSEEPTLVDLTIRRGDRHLDFRLSRVRESTLAALSQEKYARLPFFPIGERLATVSRDESQEELHAFRNFELQVGRRHGLKLAGGRWVPLATGEDEIGRLGKILEDVQSGRLARRVALISASYQPGFHVLLLKHPDQVLVYLVEPASAALQAGLLPGDEILEVDRQPVSGLNQEQLTELVLKPDDHAREIDLAIRRGGSNKTVRIETQKWEDLGYGFSVSGRAKPAPQTTGIYIVGIQLVNPGVPRERVVREVTYPSPAFGAGIHVGDVIVAVNGKRIKGMTRDQVEDLLHPVTPSPLRVDASRLGNRVHFRVTPVTAAQAEAEIGRKMTPKGPASSRCAEAPTEP